MIIAPPRHEIGRSIRRTQCQKLKVQEILIGRGMKPF